MADTLAPPTPGNYTQGQTPYNYQTPGITMSTGAAGSQYAVNNANQNYQGFLNNLPMYQQQIQNQSVDQGNQQYNNQKQQIDQSANKRGLLYSGLKTGAEQGAANSAAAQTQNNIVQGNANLENYAVGYGNQVANNNIANEQGNVNAALSQYQNQLNSYGQSQGFLGQLMGGAGSVAGSYAGGGTTAAAAAHGGKVPGKAEHEGDDPRNDTVMVATSPDEIIVPRSKSKDPEKAKKFVEDEIDGKDKDKTILDKNNGNKEDLAKILPSILAIHAVMTKRKKGGN